MEGPTGAKMICLIVHGDTEHIAIKAILCCHLIRDVLEVNLVPTVAMH